MKISQHRWTSTEGWSPKLDAGNIQDPDLLFVFGARQILQNKTQLNELRAAFGSANIIGGSTSGEIIGEEVLDDSIVVSCVKFQKTTIQMTTAACQSADQSYEAGKQLAEGLDSNQLAHVFVISDGLHVNGTELCDGLASQLPAHVGVTGGLTGDGADFSETVIIADQKTETEQVVALGLYGDSLRVGMGSAGGWDPFGPERKITRSSGSTLYELDDKDALELYKSYLGEHAAALPGSALLFPILVTTKDSSRGVVRTVLSVDPENHSMTFAGDVLEGATAQLMCANTDALVSGAQTAAETSMDTLGGVTPELALLVSCVGRKLVMKQRIEEEVEAVSEVIGNSAAIAGFYSYGELAPFETGKPCELHNQTMTITVFAEA